MIENILGVIYTICFMICYWPQIIKSIRTKSVEDISLPLFTLSVVGYISAIFYTILRVGYDFWWLSNYLAGLFSAITMVIVYYKYKRKTV